MPSSIYGKKSPKEKQSDMLATETEHVGKGNMGLPPIITDRCEAVERQWGKEALYHKPQHLAPKRGQGGYTVPTGVATQGATPVIASRIGSHTRDPALMN